ncbi:unnamed protein product [Protopolystoma xenopodis]|uniref:Phosphagen kinase C-terminal domain-containing protein n=1 Tax=Protopolystoma xenopodis TaxID=117903 RepID=A0A448WSP7_9PLAT|nr:unnamed protein product [Protopolystoma xenopodis]
MGKEDRIKVEKTIVEALKTLPGELAGIYHPLSEMNEGTLRHVINDHPFLREFSCCKDWKLGRGVFQNGEKTFLVWICEEDHIRIISLQKNGNLPVVYRRLIQVSLGG